MSYILEALKKAQAERQIGALPTIHAPTIHGGDDADSGTKLKKPLWLALIAMAVVIVVLLALVWRQAAPGTQPTAVPIVASPPTNATPSVAPAAASVPAPEPAPAPAQVLAQPASSPLPAPVAAVPAPAAGIAAPAMAASTAAPIATAPIVSHAAAAAPAAASPAQRVAASSSPTATTMPARSADPSATPVEAAAHPSSTASAEEPVQALRDLPEPIRRAIPPIVVGGYIYSRNPADRLLLIDKVLRHEGEELAPGFVLEKLLPKAAIFNYKGYRYRVAY